MERPVIFCTAYIPHEVDFPRYAYWANYYREAFPDIPLHMFHDGPVHPKYPKFLESLGVHFHVLTPHLGRNYDRGNGYFPGWKRAYAYALHYLWNFGYTSIILLESDLYIRKPFLFKFRHDYFTRPGFSAGWCKRHSFIEPSLQVINDPNIALDLHAAFKTDAIQQSDMEAEFQIRHVSVPAIISVGERLEVEVELYLRMQELEYFAQFHYATWSHHLE